MLNVTGAFQYISQLSGFLFIANNCFVFVAKDGRTALMRASDKGHANVVQPLLSVGAQVDWQDKVRHSISLQNAND